MDFSLSEQIAVLFSAATSSLTDHTAVPRSTHSPLLSVVDPSTSEQTTNLFFSGGSQSHGTHRSPSLDSDFSPSEQNHTLFQRRTSVSRITPQSLVRFGLQSLGTLPTHHNPFSATDPRKRLRFGRFMGLGLGLWSIYGLGFETTKRFCSWSIYGTGV